MLKDLAIMSGLKSNKALTACENFTDDHKAWQILQISISHSYLHSVCCVHQLEGVISNFYQLPCTNFPIFLRAQQDLIHGNYIKI